MLFRGSRDGFSNAKFHELCDNKGPLLVLFLTGKDILCGGFSSISWKNTGDWAVDPKCFLFSLKTRKVYHRLNDTKNLCFQSDRGPWFGFGAKLGITNTKKLYIRVNDDPFKISVNSSGTHEITEEKDSNDYECKDYEVF